MVTMAMFVTMPTSFRSDATRITTTLGDIEGKTEVINGVTIDIYLGIPFATPPLGDLRFRAPQPMSAWSGVKQTTTQPNCCMQTPDTSFGRFSGVEMWNPNTNISEDCLYLNMWIPRNNDTARTTMVWIYGGSFVYGSITLDVYDGRYLAAKQGVIVASMQYRMGVLGFLYSKSDEAPGNMGLLDQQLGMKWIYDNVERFGGDKNKLTLFGESAGSASTSHHLLAPSSWPYFNNAIMLSSTSLSFWAVETPEYLLNKIRDFAKIMNCEDVSLDKIVQCLRKADASAIQSQQWSLVNKNIGTFVPTVDGKFLPDYPEKLLSSGSVKKTEVLMGNTKDEGEFFILYFYPDLLPDSIWEPITLNRTQYLQMVSRIADCKGNDELCTDGLLYTYELSNLPSTRNSYLDINDDMLGDSLFKCSVRDLALYHAMLAQGRTYLYSFEYRHSANPWPDWMGVLHGYEIELVFGLPFNLDLNYSALDRDVSAKIMKYFTTFAKTGNLDSFVTEWPHFSVYSEEHIVFSQNGSTEVREGFRTKECSFWSNFMPKLKQRVSTSGSLTDSTLVVDRNCSNGGVHKTGGANYHHISINVVCLALIISTIIVCCL